MISFFRAVGLLIGILILFALDAAFFPSLGQTFVWMNMTLVVCLYLVTIFRHDLALLLWVVMTILFSLSVSQLFFFPFLAGILLLLFLDMLIEQFFTNRSYYVLMTLAALGWLLYHMAFFLFYAVLAWVSPEALVPEIRLYDIRAIVVLLVPISILLSIAYLFTNYISRRFRSYFILSDKY